MDQYRLNKIKNAPFVVIGLMAINCLLFLLVEIGGPSENARHLYRWGAMLTSSVRDRGEYWRLFTSLFLHFGIAHLGSNMLVLFALGTLLEKGLGHWRILLIYLLSGLGANLVSQLWHVKTGQEFTARSQHTQNFGIRFFFVGEHM